MLTYTTKIFLYYMVGMNLAAFCLYGIDKSKAIHHRWRIRESVLIGISFLGGALGACLGMSFFRHKTKKPKFRILVPFSLVLWMTIIYLLQR